MVVQIGQNPHEPVPVAVFAARPNWPAGGEVLSLAGLRSRVDADVLTRPQRPAFHSALTLAAGTVTATVDFVDVQTEGGEWLWVRPGQVLQWRDFAGAEGTLVLFRPEELGPETAAVTRSAGFGGPVLRPGSEDDQRALEMAVLHLEREYTSFGGLPADVHTHLLRHLLAVLVLRLGHTAQRHNHATAAPDDTYSRFQDAVEEHFTRTHRVEDYARRLGYSPRTLTRATHRTAGISAKAFIARRVALEAKRMLAHTDWSASQIAARLGFSSATNFGKFFVQHTGTRPGAFRRTIRGNPRTLGPTVPAPDRG